MHHLTHRTYRRAFRQPLRTAHGWWTEREGILVRVEKENGAIGFGEIAPIPGFGTETLAEAQEVLGKFNGDVGEDALEHVPEHCGCVRFGLSCALADAPRLPAASAPVPLTALLPAGQAAIRVLADRIENGFLSAKWKVGVEDISAEFGILDDLCSLLPPYINLRLDANGAWNRRQAARWLSLCAERPVEFVEQPLGPEDADGLRGLADDYPVTLALDESVVRLEHALRWQGEGWPGVLVVKPAIFGTLEELADWAQASKADVVLSSAVESVVAQGAILRFVQARGESLTKRALGFGVGPVFADATWNGTQPGPLLDSTWADGSDVEALWNALS